MIDSHITSKLTLTQNKLPFWAGDSGVRHMIWENWKHSEHLDELPFTIQGGISDTVVYIRIGYDQYWRNPKGGWEKTSYLEVLETIKKMDEMANKATPADPVGG